MLTHEKCFRPWKLTLVFIGVSQVVVQYFGHLMQRTESFEKTILTCFLLSQKFCMCQLLSPVQLFATPWTVAHKAPLSMEFSGKTTGVGSHSLLRGSFQSREQTWVSCIAGRFITTWATRAVLTEVISVLRMRREISKKTWAKGVIKMMMGLVKRRCDESSLWVMLPG